MEQKDMYCYRCAAPATSFEHVPPKGIFPEQKDLLYDFRVNLIKVPSCELHNMKKSMDDEFLMICIASSTKANYAGYFHFKTKVLRALLRKHKHFMNQIIKNAESIYVNDGNGNMIPVLKGQPDIERLKSCFELIAYGVYFAEYNSTFKGKVDVVPDFMIHETKNQESFIKLLEYSFEKDKSKLLRKGENSDIFYYQFTEPDKFGLISLKLTFYENINVYIAMKPEGHKEPFDLAMAIANRGGKTIFKFDDKTVEFN